MHTRRTIEIPAVGGLLCAERTKEHLDLYKEGEEAVFWENADECAVRCLELLKSPAQSKEIARRGYERCLKNNLFNEPILGHIIQEAMAK